MFTSMNITSIGNNNIIGSSQVISHGAVLLPKYITSAPGFTQNSLQDGPPQFQCQVVENYRSSSPLDILGSIGGLLALLQGVHIFLFGRPLFWGLFGELFLTEARWHLS